MHVAMAQYLGKANMLYILEPYPREAKIGMQYFRIHAHSVSQVEGCISILTTNHWLNRLVTMITLHRTSCGWKPL